MIEKEKLLDLIIAIPGIIFFIYIFYLVYKYSYTIKPHGYKHPNRTWHSGGGFRGSSGGRGGFGGGGGGGFGGAGATGGW